MTTEIVAVQPSPQWQEESSVDAMTGLYRAERELRYRVLRAPLGMAPGSEQNAYEWTCMHWVALRDGVVVGCVLLHVFDDDGLRVGKLMQMAVDGAIQGQGVGRRLVEDVRHHAKAIGLQSIVLHARETAVAFYERLGADCEGEPFSEVGIPHRRMRLVL